MTVPQISEYLQLGQTYKCGLEGVDKAAFGGRTSGIWGIHFAVPKSAVLKDECQDGDLDLIPASVAGQMDADFDSTPPPSTQEQLAHCHSLCDMYATWGAVACTTAGGVTRNGNVAIACGIYIAGLWQACHWKCDHPY